MTALLEGQRYQSFQYEIFCLEPSALRSMSSGWLLASSESGLAVSGAHQSCARNPSLWIWSTRERISASPFGNFSFTRPQSPSDDCQPSSTPTQEKPSFLTTGSVPMIWDGVKVRR